LEKGKEYHCEELNSTSASDWRRLVEKNAQGGFYHTLKWKEVIERFRGKTSYFLVYRDGEVAALCPFYQSREVKGPLSMGVLNTVENIIVRYPDDTSVVRQIALKCKELMNNERLSLTNIYLLPGENDCFRSMNLLPRPRSGASAGNMTLDLREYSPQGIWNSLSRNDRRRIRLLERDGWVVNEATSRDELSLFYSHHKANLEYLQAKCEDFRYFEYLMQTFMTPSSREMLLLLLRKNETVAGGLVIFLFDAKRAMYIAYASLNRQMPNRYRPVPALVWNAIKKASEMGYTTVAFGGTPANPNDIHYRIKEKFGGHFELKYAVPFFKSRALNSALTSLTYIFRFVKINRERLNLK
jgi:hypothetical protein